jgi:hypothetical protein
VIFIRPESASGDRISTTLGRDIFIKYKYFGPNKPQVRSDG